jgi:tRNA 5-methylaminomethyl-2-thiouridine biosynthesis bifunctional protein
VQIDGMTDPATHHSADYRLASAPLSHRDGVLRADDFDDLYFSTEDGLGEARHVFLDGNDLAGRIAAAPQFTIAETGFGTGLNFLAVMALLESNALKQDQLGYQIDYISFESRPLPAAVMAQSHQAFPYLARHSDNLITALPPQWPGLHRRDFLQGRLRLHLIYGDANDAVAKADFAADAWFLDGFTPARNPQLWNQDLLMAVGRLTRAGGSFATFTVANAVRQRLAEAGFELEKRPGFGRKRDMLVGRKRAGTLTPQLAAQKRNIAIIGGGIAGASVAAGLVARGMTPHIIDARDRLAGGASGNRLALQSPRLSVDHNVASRMSADCLSFAARCSDVALAVVADRVISLDWPDREAVRQTKFRAQFWPDDLMQFVDAKAASSQAGIDLPLGGVVHHWGRVIDPICLTNHLAKGAETHFGFSVVGMRRDDGKYHLFAHDGRQLTCDQLIVAAGADLATLHQMLAIQGIAIDVTSGQVSHVPETATLAGLRAGISFGGYLTPAKDGFHELGATFDREGNTEILASAHLHNKQLLPRGFGDGLPNPASYGARVSKRASTADRNPFCGKINEDLFILGALGARGLTLAPLLGDMLAAEILGMPVTLSRDIRRGLDPYRFRLRASRL